MAQEYGIDPAVYLWPLDGASPQGREFVWERHDLLISYARLGWHPAARLLCEFAVALRAEGQQLPAWLQDYLVSRERQHLEEREPEKACGKLGRQGRDQCANVHRDMCIANAVRCTVEGFGYKPTRNAGTAQKRPLDERGCSIVWKALQSIGVHTMTEGNVARIWRTTKKGTQSSLDQRVAIGSAS